MARAAHVVVAGVFLVLAGCSSAQDEPAGLTGSRSAATDVDPAGTTAPTDGPDESAPTSSEPSNEPNPSFTQPFVPGEPSVIELPDQLPIDIPADATDEERAVLEATRRFMASWDAVLFGAGEDESGIHETATGEQLERLIDLGVKVVMQRTVTVGESTVIDLVDVSVDGDTAQVDMCITMRDWVTYTDGEPEELDELERQVVTMVRAGDTWKASDSKPMDASSCS